MVLDLVVSGSSIRPALNLFLQVTLPNYTSRNPLQLQGTYLNDGGQGLWGGPDAAPSLLPFSPVPSFLLLSVLTSRDRDQEVGYTPMTMDTGGRSCEHRHRESKKRDPS